MQTIKAFCKKITNFFTEDSHSAIFWLVIRVYVGYEWFMAGWEKMMGNGWIGSNAGAAVTGFLNGSLAKAYAVGAHHDVSMWYAWLVQNVFIPNAVLFSYMVTFGEILVGAALILGLFTGVSAFFGAFMNLNYLFAGTVSTNPLLLILQVFLISGRKVAGWIGLDRYVKKA